MNNNKQIIAAGESLLSKIKQEDGYCRYSCEFFGDYNEYDPDLKYCTYYWEKLIRDKKRTNSQYQYPCCQKCQELMNMEGE